MKESGGSWGQLTEGGRKNRRWKCLSVRGPSRMMKGQDESLTNAVLVIIRCLRINGNALCLASTESAEMVHRTRSSHSMHRLSRICGPRYGRLQVTRYCNFGTPVIISAERLTQSLSSMRHLWSLWQCSGHCTYLLLNPHNARMPPRN